MNFNQDQILLGFLQELLTESFAQRENFREKDLETICSEIELAFGSSGAQTESFEKSRDLLCLILSHLELSGVSEIPKGKIGLLFESKSKFLEAVDLFKQLKNSGKTKLQTTHLNRLIGQHLCLELEEQANILLKPIFKKSLPQSNKFYPLEQLSALAVALDLDPTLAKHLESLSEKKSDALNWGKEISESWLSELDIDFIAALKCLEQYLERDMEMEKAA